MRSVSQMDCQTMHEELQTFDTSRWISQDETDQNMQVPFAQAANLPKRTTNIEGAVAVKATVTAPISRKRKIETNVP